MPDLRRSLILAAGLLSGCFDPTSVPLDTDTDTDGGDATITPGTAGDDDDDGGGCPPGAMQACTCDDGGSGMQTCASDGSGFGACECEDTDTTVDPTDPDTTTGPPPECTVDDDCAAMDDECVEGVCNAAGECETQPADAGTACGSSTDTICDGADTCDGAGACVDNHAPIGFECTGCGDDMCTCDGAGACGPCPDFADGNSFNTPRSIAGWDLQGDWGLYIAAPQSRVHAEVPFGTQVFGTDGNRTTPYPLNHDEASTATSRPFILPASITFQSWHVDEGGGTCGVDQKGVFVSVDGGTSWTPLADCCGPGPYPPFCNFFAGPRAAAAWDPITLPVPAPMVGQEGMLQFRYDTLDSCCDFEQGWFIDASNIAPECACGTDATCDPLGGECGAGVCAGDGQCDLDGIAAGMACGDADDATCAHPDSCNGFGYCLANDEPNGHASCDECASGLCGGCVDGMCVDCPSQEYDPTDIGLWVSEAIAPTTNPGWGFYYSAPPNQAAGSTSTSFGARAPVIGTDGNRLSPYGAAPGNLHHENSQWTTAPFEVPSAITFESWNQDEGGTDQKRIELSVNGGLTWTTLANCQGVGNWPFCTFVNDRPIDSWDAITIDTSAFEGQTGQLRFGYNTQDACCSFERGWYINDLNVLTQCADPIPFPP